MGTNDILTILEVLNKSSDFLARKSVPSHKTDAEWILAHCLKCKKMDLYLRFGETLSEKVLTEIKTMVIRRAKRVPLQHILGNVQFAGLTLKSDSRALIPRCETEFLVDILFQKMGAEFNGHILDLGSGSGAILLALCSLMPNATGLGLDKSNEAIRLSLENLSACKLEKRASFKQFDWVKDNRSLGIFDLVVSNPPYLSKQEWENAEPEVKYHDPKIALISEKEGLADIEKVVLLSDKYLRRGGFLALEFGHKQADKVWGLLTENYEINLTKDQNMVRRFAIAQKKS